MQKKSKKKPAPKSITANHIDIQSRVGDDFDYVNIGVTWKGKNHLERPTECKKTQVMWSHDSVFGVVGSKVGDFVDCYGDGSSNQEGVFTHRHIAELLVRTFTGLKYHELKWLKNPREKTLASGKPRLKKAKWLPEKSVDLVHLYSDVYIDVNNPIPITTDFFTVIRWEWDKDESGAPVGTPSLSTWFMCNDKTAKKLKGMNFSCLYIRDKVTIVEVQN